MTDKSEMPKKIWAYKETVRIATGLQRIDLNWREKNQENYDDMTQYIRADLHEAQREVLRVAREALQGFYCIVDFDERPDLLNHPSYIKAKEAIAAIDKVLGE